MNDRVFFDTNVLIYSVVNDPNRTPSALAWLSRGGIISAQVLNEFTNTARRKLNRPWSDVVAALDAIRLICSECIPITEQTHDVTVGLAGHHGFHLYDALIIASALDAKCRTLATEDMQDGQVIHDRLKIHNKFR